MESRRYGMEYFPAELESDLIKLIRLQEMPGAEKGISMGPTAWSSSEAKIPQLLKKAREIANKHHPESFGVSVGIPFGAQVTFTWKT